MELRTQVQFPYRNKSTNQNTYTHDLNTDNSSNTTSAETNSSREICEKIRNNLGVVMDKPKHPEYAVLEKRIQTFENCRDSDALLHISGVLAKCGFVFEGVSGTVKCFHCSTTVNTSSLLSADPWRVHAEKFAFCAHVRHCKGDKYILRIHGDDTVSSEECGQEVRDIDEYMEVNSVAIEAALTLFNFPEETVKRAAERLMRDQKRTFSGVEFVKVAEDLDKVGEELSEETCERMELDTEQFNDTTDTEALLRENEELMSTFNCKICLEGIADVIVLPCGHLACCSQCVSAMTKCPLCRSHIKATVKAFFRHDIE